MRATVRALLPQASASVAPSTGYRKSHVVTSAPDAGTGYQVPFTIINTTGSDSGNTVYLNGRARSDFADLRFTAADGTTVLSYYIESVVGTTATVWVKVAADLTASDQTIYVKYGSNLTTTTASGPDTFIFFDDFSGAALDTSKWSSVNTTSSQASGLLTATGTSDPGKILMNNTMGQNTCLHVRFRERGVTSNSGERVGLAIFTASNGVGVNYVFRGDSVRAFLDDGVQWFVQGSEDPVDNKWHVAEVWWIGGGIYANMAPGYAEAVATSQVNIRGYYAGLNTGSFGAVTTDFDYVFAMKRTAPEPGHGAWGAEQAA